MNGLTETLYRRASEVRYRIVDGEAVVIRQRAAEVLGLNPVGSTILDLIDGQRGTAEIVAGLVERYSVEPSVAADDVRRFLAELRDSGLIEPVQAAAR